MFYKFKIVKDGLKFLGTSRISENKKNIIYISESDIGKISPEIITNPSSLKEVI